MMISPSPLKCIRAVGSQGCAGSSVLSGFWAYLVGLCVGSLVYVLYI
jgi:hypothetical protein